ncbi:membrane fusion efflux protein [Algibacter lectus]|uniref:Membrane fusion efflux protein n=1 Tax=Algibacter lectus TaxID=221126 RepID=A0A090WUS5_9FLAO|nr:membrane fusion efflux protein [Algibacter lectus]
MLAIREALLQYNRITEKPFVEIFEGDNKYRKENVELGLSDGINVEILEGVKEGDKIKVWNKASKDNEDEDEDEN